jgi:hypothetical protein
MNNPITVSITCGLPTIFIQAKNIANPRVIENNFFIVKPSQYAKHNVDQTLNHCSICSENYCNQSIDDVDMASVSAVICASLNVEALSYDSILHQISLGPPFDVQDTFDSPFAASVLPVLIGLFCFLQRAFFCHPYWTLNSSYEISLLFKISGFVCNR